MTIIIILTLIVFFWIYSKAQLTDEEKLVNYIAETFESDLNDFLNSPTDSIFLKVGVELIITTTENSLLLISSDLSVKYGIPKNKVIQLIQSISASISKKHIK